MKWIGKPEFKPYRLSSLIKLSNSLIFIGIVYGVFYAIMKIEKDVMNWIYIHGFAILIGGQALYAFYKRMRIFKNLNYEITGSEIKISHDGLEPTTKIINRQKVQFIETKTYLPDKIYGTRTIKIYSGEIKNEEDEVKKNFDLLENISDSNDMTSILKLEKVKHTVNG
jgi:membrane protein YdbS with pleckstrin-like domain